MKANETELQKFIGKNKQFVVPLFQRPYSWEKKHWQTLWNDLLDLYQGETPKSHFLGAVVTAQIQTVPEGVSKHVLIDGQQRLTTIFILLCAIRDAAKSESSILADKIHHSFLINPDETHEEIFKLLPTQSDRDEFFCIIKQEKPIDKNALLSRAYDFFSTQLHLSKAQLEKLTTILINHVYVVSIALDSDDNPYLIFESLNAKGRPLTQGDLVRNYFLMRIHIEKQEIVFKSLWLPMEERLGDKLTLFLRHFLLCDYAAVREDEVYFMLKKICDKQSEENIIEYLTKIERFSRYYAQFIHPDRCSIVNVREKLAALNIFRVSTCYPFLLCLFDYFSRGGLTEAYLLETLTVVENFIVRRDICDLPTQGLNAIFPPLFNQIDQLTNGEFCSALKDILSTKNYPSDSDFKKNLATKKLYGGDDQQRKTKFMLLRIEYALGHKERIDPINLSIEHVMPQTLTSWWKQQLGENFSTIHAKNLHMLGNLTLTGYNSELSNAVFSTKKNILLNSRLRLNGYFKNCNEWGLNEIHQRTQYLIEKALTVWSSFVGKNNEIPFVLPKVTGLQPARVLILGETLEVFRWAEVVQVTLHTLFTFNPGKVELAITAFPRFLTKNEHRLRRPATVIPGVFVEKNCSAKDLYRFCQQITAFFGIAASEYTIETTQRQPA